MQEVIHVIIKLSLGEGLNVHNVSQGIHLGASKPTVFYVNFEDARDEAVRLASQNPGNSFAVLSTTIIAAAELHPVTVRNPRS